MANLTPALTLLSALLVTQSTPLASQSYRDFMLVRNRQQPYRSLLQIRAGWRATDPEGENQSTGLVEDDSIDGFLLYHSKELSAREDWALDFYAGQDGVFLSVKDDLNYGKQSQTRLELFGRPKAFFRDGYYTGGHYLIRGQYEGRDYGLRLSTAQSVDQDLILDIGAFYKVNEFSRNAQTELRGPLGFEIPDDFNSYGSTVTIEQNTIKLDRVLGLPQSGVLMTVMAEYALNDSNKMWGSTAYTTKLASGFWRGHSRIEFYVPNSKSGVWEILADLGLYDKSDRVTSYHAEHVQGYLWGDGTLGYRMAIGQSFVFKPYLQLQYSKALDEQGTSSNEHVFWGGGVDMSLIFGNNMAMVLNYSYVNNPSRGHVSLQNDFYGEHQFFIGMDVSFGSGYRR